MSSKIQHLSPFEFEKTFDVRQAELFLTTYRWAPWLSVFIYLAFLYVGTGYMKNKDKFDLRRLLIIWNTSLAIFSIAGAIRTHPELAHALSIGLRHSICVEVTDNTASLWIFLFVLSKVVELGDTIFIVLRKQPLIFLHWYHHVTVLLYCWFALGITCMPARWFTSINMAVHSIMYSYYAVKSMGYRPYKFIAMAITTLQVLQMFMGCFIHTYLYVVWFSEDLQPDLPPCNINLFFTNMGFLMYFSFLILFSNYFYRSYIHKKPLNSKKLP